jgi:hypothetical protein
MSNDGPQNIVDSVIYISSRVWADAQGRNRWPARMQLIQALTTEGLLTHGLTTAGVKDSLGVLAIVAPEHLSLLKTPNRGESLEICASPPYRRGHDHDSFCPPIPALIPTSEPRFAGA